MIKTLTITLLITALHLGAPGTAASQCTKADNELEPRAIVIEKRIAEAEPHGPEVRLVEVPASAGRGGLEALGLRFHPGDGAAIDYGSVRIRYGRLGLDITGRVAACFDLRKGLMVDGATLPRGRHRLRVQVEDDQARSAELFLAVRVI